MTGTAQVTVPYRNRFKNEVLIDGRASVKSGSLGGIGFTNTANNYVNSIGSITGSDSTQAHLVFRTGTANASMNSLSERMRIDKDGNVAIGLTTALAKLHVATNATSIAAVQTIETIGTGGRPYTLYRAESSNYGYVGYGISSSNVMSVFNYKNAALQFGTNSAPRMSISADGKVGVGTLAPAYKLDVNGDIRVNKGSAIRFFRADSATNGLNIYSAKSNNFIHSVTGGLIHISSAAISLDATSGHNFRNYDGSSTFMTISNTGNVGIGVAAPTKRLELGGSRSIAFDTGVGTMKIKADVGFWAMNYGFKGSSDTDWGGLWGHGSADALSHWSIGKSYLDNFLVVKNNGQIGIGTTTIPTDYKLAVAGNIIAEKVKVKKQVNGAWPDYVFSPTYKLPSLEEIEQFTKKNNHLPEIPSAREIENEGQDLGEMNRLLLKKVEELTLYMIEQNKEIKALKLKVEQLEKK
ncbi:hypothetical protein [Emticicia sp. 17c]|uniref:hypothetical protein n=1 Tax=Emticicia sp. 17c TaxID=3127704 RepID=UPI00301CB7AD